MKIVQLSILTNHEFEFEFKKKKTTVSRPFAEISDQIEKLAERAIPDKTKTATKYGMKIFNGKIHVYYVFDIQFCLTETFFLPTKAEICQCLKPLNCRCKHDKTFSPKRYFIFTQ